MLVTLRGQRVKRLGCYDKRTLCNFLKEILDASHS